MLIRYLGLGWEGAHHAWSDNGNSFTSTELLKHLLNVFILIEVDELVPLGPPLSVSVPTMTKIKPLETTSELALELERLSGERQSTLNREAYLKKASRQKSCDGDEWEEQQ